MPLPNVQNETIHAYDALGRPISRNADTFGYNTRGEVVFSRRDAESAEDTYSYDDIGNLLLSSVNAVTNLYCANNLNQYSSISNLCGSAPLREITYDLDGNLVTNIFNSPFSFFHSYAYDAANRLVSVSSNGLTVATFAYDAQGRRVRKIVSHGGTETQRFDYIYDGWLLVNETVQRSNGQTVQRSYYWGKDLSGSFQGAGGIGGLLYLAVSNSNSQLQLYIPFYDNNGNITHYCDAQGNVVASYTYDAFGNTIAQSGPMADTFCHRFSTKYFDAETGLYYYGYRFYSPVLMRWVNRDPIGEDGGLNLYAMCGNEMPWNFDPLGEDRYITHFDFLNLGGSGGTQIHVGVAVDTWECYNGFWIKTGIKTFDFMPKETVFDTLLAAIVTRGHIKERDGLYLRRPITITSEAKQDIAMLNKIREDIKHTPLYSFWLHNCIIWATNAINYGY